MNQEIDIMEDVDIREDILKTVQEIIEKIKQSRLPHTSH